jgi:hypothetical protein
VGWEQLNVFSSSLLPHVKITLFLCISFSSKINNKSAMKKFKDILIEEKLHILRMDQLRIKKTPRLMWLRVPTPPPSPS